MPTISKINYVITYIFTFLSLICSSKLKNDTKYVIDNISEICAC
jgi:hypothetical protein